ncbi:WH1-domain-containing protein [Colletotrichum tofieldiae]|nr:WH1-domain-containing protein [Colletotrichum tofieldiae]GKT73721.1 WH1-domain-containing protein [Colletotrichum tofieldiae]
MLQLRPPCIHLPSPPIRPVSQRVKTQPPHQHSPPSQGLLQNLKPQIVPQRPAVDELVVRKLPPLPRLAVPPPLVPRNQLGPRPDDTHLHPLGPPPPPRILLGVRQHGPPHPAGLPVRAHGEEPKVRHRGVRLAARDLAARQRRRGGGGVRGDEDDPLGLGDLGEEPGLADALVRDEVGLRGPPLAGESAAVGGADEREEAGDVGGRGGAEGEGLFGGRDGHCGSSNAGETMWLVLRLRRGEAVESTVERAVQR